MIIRFIITFTVALCTIIDLRAQGVPYFKGTVHEALAAAQNQRKMLIVEFYAAWNYKSRWSHDNVIAKEQVCKAIDESFVIVMVDTQTAQGAELALQYQVKDYPCFIVFNQNGNVVDLIDMTLDVTDFVTRLNQVVLANDGSSALMMRRIITAAQSDDMQSVDPLVKEFVDKIGEDRVISPLFWELFTNSQVCKYGSYTFEYMFEHRDRFDSVFTKNVVDDLINGIIVRQTMKYVMGTLEADSMVLNDIIRKAGLLNSDRSNTINSLMTLVQLRQQKDVSGYIEVLAALLRVVDEELISQLVITIDFIADIGDTEQKKAARHLLDRYGRSSKSRLKLELIQILDDKLSE